MHKNDNNLNGFIISQEQDLQRRGKTVIIFWWIFFRQLIVFIFSQLFQCKHIITSVIAELWASENQEIIVISTLVATLLSISFSWVQKTIRITTASIRTVVGWLFVCFAKGYSSSWQVIFVTKQHFIPF